MKHAVSILVAFVVLAGCAARPKPYQVTVPEGRRVEDMPLPEDAMTEDLPDGTPPADWVESIERGQCVNGVGDVAPTSTWPCPAKAGIVVSEARATRDAILRIRYPELRINYEADRVVWRAEREMYEERLRMADEAIQRLQPSWWERHDAQIALISGLLLGVAASVSVAVTH